MCFLFPSCHSQCFCKQLRHRYLQMVTADTVNTTHVRLLPSFRLFFLFSRRRSTQVAYHFDIANVNATALITSNGGSRFASVPYVITIFCTSESFSCDLQGRKISLKKLKNLVGRCVATDRPPRSFDPPECKEPQKNEKKRNETFFSKKKANNEKTHTKNTQKEKSSDIAWQSAHMLPTPQFQIVECACHDDATQAQHRSWRFVPDAILPVHWRAHWWVPAWTPTVHQCPHSGKAVVGFTAHTNTWHWSTQQTRMSPKQIHEVTNTDSVSRAQNQMKK